MLEPGLNRATDGAKNRLWPEECPHAAMFLLLVTGGGASSTGMTSERSPELKGSVIRNTDTYPNLSHK